VSEPSSETRRSPWLVQGILLALFLLVAAVGVFTVVLPEIEDDGDEETEEIESEAPESRP